MKGNLPASAINEVSVTISQRGLSPAEIGQINNAEMPDAIAAKAIMAMKRFWRSLMSLLMNRESIVIPDKNQCACPDVVFPAQAGIQ